MATKKQLRNAPIGTVAVHQHAIAVKAGLSRWIHLDRYGYFPMEHGELPRSAKDWTILGLDQLPPWAVWSK